MLSGLWNLIFFALALGILISFHELGHYLAARWCGVRVLRFSLGFGPILYKRILKNGCEFALSAISLGGYVKMAGEGGGEEAAVPKSECFAYKSLKQRALIIAAGPAFNIVLAFVLYSLINFVGVSVLRPVVGDVIPGSRAEAAGLMLYDEIVAVDGKDVDSWNVTAMLLVERFNDQDKVELGVRSDLGTGAPRNVLISLSGLTLSPQQNPLQLIGLRPCAGKVSDRLTRVEPGSPAYNAGLETGDRIVSVNGKATPSWYRVQDAVASGGSRLNVQVERDGVIYQSEIFPEQRCEGQHCRPVIGVGVDIEPMAELMRIKSYGPVDAVVKAAADTGRMSLFIISSTYKLISGQISADNISGPIAIAKGAGQSASFGFIFFLSFLAAISVNLGILNLLPIPVLDGGQLLFIAYEGITGLKPSPKVQYALSLIGFALIIALSLFAVFNDLKAL